MRQYGEEINKDKSSNEAVRICFVALGAYALLTGRNPINIIGPDIQQFLLAKELLNYKFRIIFITYGENSGSVEIINDIEIITIQASTHRLRLINIMVNAFHIWGAMKKADASIYSHRGGAAGVISLFCRFKSRKFVYQIASNGLVNRELITQKIKDFSRSKFSVEVLGFWLDNKFSDAIIVQNEYQKKMLKKNFGKNSVLIKNPFPLTKKEMPNKANPPVVIWVGSMAEVKQPELFVNLAEAIPDARFQMIGGHSGNQELYDRIKERGKRLSNFESLGVVPFDEIDKYFGRASILVNTSMFEGFPNAFIQAWMHYVPVISLNADPDELIYKEKLGFHSKTFEKMIEDVRTLLEDEKLRKDMGKSGRQYAEKEHDIAKNVINYVRIFEQVLDT